MAPWNKMYVYGVRIQEAFESMELLSRNGLGIKVDLSFRFSPVQDKIGYVHDEIGTSYADKIIKPEIRSFTGEVITKYLPEEPIPANGKPSRMKSSPAPLRRLPNRTSSWTPFYSAGGVAPDFEEAIERNLKEEQSFEYKGPFQCRIRGVNIQEYYCHTPDDTPAQTS